MQMHIRNSYHLPVLMLGFGFLTLDSPVTAQTFTTLHSFTTLPISPPYTNSDGANPSSILISSSNALYGTASQGGTWRWGTVFKVNADGTSFTNIYNFTGASDDGASPNSLILSGNILYGTSYGNANPGYGTVFAMRTNGSDSMNLHGFSCSDGSGPGGLILSGNTLYGTTTACTLAGNGTVFKVSTDGTGFTNIHVFTITSGLGTNSDGAEPTTGVILSDNTLYGTAFQGGSWGFGTVFRVNTDGTSFTTLYNFTGGSDGANPNSSLVLSGDTLYGTTFGNANPSHGTVFAVKTNGSGFATLYTFTTPDPSTYTNSDGFSPWGRLILSNNTLYGIAESGGSSGNGTVFAVHTNGSGFVTLYNFTAPDLITGTNGDGALPTSLILCNNALYGTTYEGGNWGSGTVFSLTLPLLPPQLTIAHSQANVILSWPTNVTGFALQASTDVGASAIWTTNLPSPVVINGQNTVTNPISGTQQFFRLSQ